MRYLLAIVLALASCSRGGGPPVLAPGGTLSLVSVARALECGGEVSWTVVEPGGGAITPTGVYTAPPCGSGSVGTFHVQAAGCARSITAAVVVADPVASVEVVCGAEVGAACCRSPIFAAAGGPPIQLYAAVRYACPGHVEYSPRPPPPLCP